jgi:DNA-directed RNA polymerase specialized sigma24 family protein
MRSVRRQARTNNNPSAASEARFYPGFTNLRFDRHTVLTVARQLGGMDSTSPLCRAYMLHRSRLISLARSRGAAEHEAEDVVQDVFATLIRTGRLEEVGALAERSQSAVLTRRLHSALINRWRDRHRQCRDQSRVVEISNADDIPQSGDPASEMDRAWALRAIDHALDHLRDEIAEDQWTQVEPVLRGEARLSKAPSSSTGRLRTAVCRARKRLRVLVSRDDLQAALLAA